MNHAIEINNQSISIKEYQGRRVITLKDVDTVHQRPEGTARRNFNTNQERFIENTDYFVIDQPYEIRTLGLERPQGGTPSSIILLTESGYLMLVKSFNDDLAWDVQRDLVNHYFKENVGAPILMESVPYPRASMGEVANFIQSMRLLMEKERIPPNVIALTIAKMSRAWGVEFPTEFVGSTAWLPATYTQIQFDNR